MTNKYCIALLLIVISMTSHAKQTDHHKEINCLLEIVEKSKGVFIRNGDKHSSKKAREHLEYKYKQATKSSWPFYKKVTVTTKKFIEKIASKSSFSGNPYQIQFGSEVFLTRDWLFKKLSNSCRTQS